jgi:hypothetical protein
MRWNSSSIRTLRYHNKRREQVMRGEEMNRRWRTAILSLIAIPIPIIILLYLFHSNHVGCLLL